MKQKAVRLPSQRPRPPADSDLAPNSSAIGAFSAPMPSTWLEGLSEVIETESCQAPNSERPFEVGALHVRRPRFRHIPAGCEVSTPSDWTLDQQQPQAHRGWSQSQHSLRYYISREKKLQGGTKKKKRGGPFLIRRSERPNSLSQRHLITAPHSASTPNPRWRC